MNLFLDVQSYKPYNNLQTAFLWYFISYYEKGKGVGFGKKRVFEGHMVDEMEKRKDMVHVDEDNS